MISLLHECVLSKSKRGDNKETCKFLTIKTNILWADTLGNLFLKLSWCTCWWWTEEGERMRCCLKQGKKWLQCLFLKPRARFCICPSCCHRAKIRSQIPNQDQKYKEGLHVLVRKNTYLPLPFGQEMDLGMWTNTACIWTKVLDLIYSRDVCQYKVQHFENSIKEPFPAMLPYSTTQHGSDLNCSWNINAAWATLKTIKESSVSHKSFTLRAV